MAVRTMLFLAIWTGIVIGLPYFWQFAGGIYAIIGMVPAMFVLCFAGELLFGNHPDLVGSARNDAMINDWATASLICGGAIVWLIGCGLYLLLTGKSKEAI